MSKSRKLKIRCTTWDQVEAFYAKKITGDRSLVVRVPFNPDVGSVVTLALGLPNDRIMGIDGDVVAAKPAADGKRAQVKLALRGLTDEVIARLQALVAESRGETVETVGTDPPTLTQEAAQKAAAAAVGKDPTTMVLDKPIEAPTKPTEPPPSEPADAPVDEVVPPRPAASVEAVQGTDREVFIALEKEHRRLREAAANEVLGVDWDADVAAIRGGYFRLAKAYHPDVFAHYRSEPISQLIEELFIHINKAYDRMRQAVVEAGKGIIAGPALLPHNGWVVGMEDVVDRTSGKAAQAPIDPAPKPLVIPDPVEVPQPEIQQPAMIPPPILPSQPPAPNPRPISAPDVDSLAIPEPVAVEQSEEVVVQFGDETNEDAFESVPMTHAGLFGDLSGEEGAVVAGSRSTTETSVLGHLFTGSSIDDSQAGRVNAMEGEARSLIAEGAFDQARERLAAALHMDARNRPLRALYHVANGHFLADAGKKVDAMMQFETALRHDPACAEAKDAIQSGSGSGKRKSGLFGKFFKQ